MIFRKIYLAIFISIIFLIIHSVSVAAQENTSPIQSSAPARIATDSFTLFWPVSAGRTVDDKLFFLKEWKESFREMFIFGDIEKADYKIYLSTKRIVETEKLLKENKNSVALQSLEKAAKHLDSVKKILIQAKEDNKINKTDNIKKQLGNLKLFLPYLKSNTENDIQSRIDELQGLVNDIITLL